MFWGLILEPRKRYTQEVTKPFHISNAALDVHTGDANVCQVLVVSNGTNFLLCTLQKGKSVQTPLDLSFNEGDKVSFITNGNCHIHLTGYVEPEFGMDEEDEEEEISEDEEVPQLEPISKKKRKLEETSPVDSKKSKKEKNKNKPAVNNKPKVEEEEDGSDESDDDDDSDSDTDIKKLLEESVSDGQDDSFVPEDGKELEDSDDDDDDEDDDEDDDDDDDEDDNEEDESEEEEVKKPKKEQKEKKTQQQNGHAQKENKQNDVQEKQVQKRVLAGNVVVEDLRVGQGAVAKAGKMVQVFYEGRLASNKKMFDSCTKNPGFKFRLGKKEVISGWDVGIVGMKIGGKRRITCPPGMAYGNKGSPPVIPPNSTLVFEVDLKGVN